VKVLCSTQMGSGTILGQTMRVAAIAKALQRKGHQIKYLAGGKLIPVLKDLDLDLIPLPEMPELSFSINPADMDDPSYRERALANVEKIFKILIQAEKEAVHAEKPNLMLCGNLTGALSAALYGIPCVLVFLQPHGQKTFNYFMKRMPADERAKTQFFNMMRAIAREMTGEQDLDKLLTRVMEAVSMLLVEGMPEIAGDADLTVLGEWFDRIKDKIRFTGPLLVEALEQMPKQDVLRQKYSSAPDKPLIYVTIGGGSPLIGEDFLHLVLDMFRELPEVNGLIATGLAISAEKLASYHQPDNVVIRGFVPGTELIKASDLTIFHGGSSTLMNCIACGRPAVVIPSIGEQEDNGAVLAQYGAGIVLDKDSLTSVHLKNAVQRILYDTSFQSQAWQLKEISEKYGGAGEAARMIEEMVKGRVLIGAGTDLGSR
jgi:MGT family glycosyltransferase